MAKIHVSQTDNKYYIVDDDKYNINRKSLAIHLFFLGIWIIIWIILSVHLRIWTDSIMESIPTEGDINIIRIMLIVPVFVHFLVFCFIRVMQHIKGIPKKNRLGMVTSIVQFILFSLINGALWIFLLACLTLSA